MLAFLYGLSLYADAPKYWESIAVTALLLILFGAGCVRLVPVLSSMLLGEEEQHLIREGERTYRRCGTRELFKVFLITLFVRLLEFPLTYVVHYRLFGFTGTFFEVQRLWLDFYHAESAFPLYGYLSNVFWIFTANFNHARFIGSYFFTSLSVVALYYLVQLDFDRKTARRAVRYYLLMPFSFVLMATIPDGLFLLLSILCLLFLRRKRFALANLCGMLAACTHAVGAFLFLPILISYVSYLIGNIRNNREIGKGHYWKQIGNALSMLLVPAGVGLVLLYAALRFGDPTVLYRQAFGEAGVGFSGLLKWLDSALDRSMVIGSGSVASLCGEYLPQLVYLIFALCMILLGCGTISTPAVLLMTMMIPLLFVNGRLGDTARLVTITAPFTVTLAVRIKNRWIDAVVTVLLFAAWVAYFVAFIAGYAGGIQ